MRLRNVLIAVNDMDVEEANAGFYITVTGEIMIRECDNIKLIYE